MLEPRCAVTPQSEAVVYEGPHLMVVVSVGLVRALLGVVPLVRGRAGDELGHGVLGASAGPLPDLVLLESVDRETMHEGPAKSSECAAASNKVPY